MSFLVSPPLLCAEPVRDLVLVPPGESTRPHVTVGGERVGSLDLVVASPGWESRVLTFAKTDAPRASEGGESLVGSFKGQDGPPAGYVWRSESRGGGVDLAVEVTPHRPLYNEAAMIVFTIPCDGLEGQPWIVRDVRQTRKGVFGPESRGDGGKLIRDFSNGTFAWRLSDGSYLRLRPDADSIAMWIVQDNRIHGDDSIEIQLHRIRQKVLAANQTFTMSLQIEHVTSERVMETDPLLTEEGVAKIRIISPELPKYVDDRDPRLTVIAAPEPVVKEAGLVEWSFGVEARYQNPFDPQDVRVDVEVQAPSGAVYAVPGFFVSDFSRQLRDGNEDLQPTGSDGWAARFRPRESGEYRWAVSLTDADQVVSGGTGVFAVEPNQTQGFIRISPHNPRAFAFENGESYIPIGMNLSWPDRRGTFAYDQWFDELQANGMNFARLWLAPDFNRLCLERPSLGPGQLDMTSAWMLDYIIREAERRGIYLMLCLDAHGNLSTSVNPAWHENPYSTLNGGTAKQPMDFWADPESRRRVQNKLRYLVARYGDSPSVFAWEFWNEVTLSDQSGNYHGPIRDWHQEMGRILRNLDIYDHLVTTSTAGGGHISLLDTLPEIDFVQTHSYGSRDLAATIQTVSEVRSALVTRHLTERFAPRVVKPHLFGEMGTGHHAAAVAADAEGVHLHNMIWAGLMTSTSGSAMSWWWDSYIEKYDLWHIYKAPAAFMADVQVAAGPVRQISNATFRFAEPPESPGTRPLTVAGTQASWEPGVSNRPQWLTIHPDGRVDGLGSLSRVLHGVGEEVSHYNPVSFAVSYPVAGQFSVDVESVSGWGGAALQIFIDSELVLDKDFVDPDGREITDVISSYDDRYSVDVSPGDHVIRVENHGIDWAGATYEFDGATNSAYPWLDAHGLVVEGAVDQEPSVLLWIRNRDYVWSRAVEGLSLTAVSPSVLNLEDLPDGSYTIELWDTRTGDRQPGGVVEVADGKASFPLPEIERDLAAKLVRISKPEQDISSAGEVPVEP